MVFSCDRCHVKYSVPDLKSAGKDFKLKCKRCQTLIQLQGGVVVREKQSKPRLQVAFVGAVDSALLGLLSLANQPKQIISCCTSCGAREYIQHPKDSAELPWGKPWVKCASCLRSLEKSATEIKYRTVSIEASLHSYLVTVYEDTHNAMLGLLSHTPARFDAVVLVTSTKEQRFPAGRFGCLLDVPVIVLFQQSPDEESAALEARLREELSEAGLRADEVPFLYHELLYDEPNTALEVFALLDQHTAMRAPPQEALFLITEAPNTTASLSGYCLQREFYPREVVSIVGAPEKLVTIQEETGTAKMQPQPRSFSIRPAQDVRLRPGQLLSSRSFGPPQDTFYALICSLSPTGATNQQSGSFYFYSPWIFLEEKPSPKINLTELSVQAMGRLRITNEEAPQTGSFLASVALSDSLPLSPGLRFIFMQSGAPQYALGVVLALRRFT